jgi:hypothetical protein
VIVAHLVDRKEVPQKVTLGETVVDERVDGRVGAERHPDGYATLVGDVALLGADAMEDVRAAIDEDRAVRWS